MSNGDDCCAPSGWYGEKCDCKKVIGLDLAKPGSERTVFKAKCPECHEAQMINVKEGLIVDHWQCQNCGHYVVV